MDIMEKIVLQAERRTVSGKQVKALRRQGKLPAVLYGHHFDATPITLDAHSATRTLSSLTSSSLVTIDLDGTQHAALVREKQRDFIKGSLLHVDFQVVSMTEKLRVLVSIELTGIAPAVKDFNGVVITNLDEVEVECLPQDLPERVDVDISPLAHIGDSIYVRDIHVSDKVRVLTDPDEAVVVITGGTVEEEVEAAAPVEGEVEEPEVIERGKKEEEVEE